MSWVVAFHIIGIIVWMGGLVTLARLLGHHASLEDSTARAALVKFERRSYLAAILPGFVLTLVTGIYMLVAKGGGVGHYLSADGAWGGTFHAKLTVVVLLIALDQAIFWKMRTLHRDDEGSRGFFMATHGIVGLLFIFVVILVETNLFGG